MNLIEKIGAYIAAGLSSAEAAVRLEAEHAVTVTEEWIDKIRGADGFSHVVASVQAAESTAVDTVSTAVTDATAQLEAKPADGTGA